MEMEISLVLRLVTVVTVTMEENIGAGPVMVWLNCVWDRNHNMNVNPVSSSAIVKWARSQQWRYTNWLAHSLVCGHSLETLQCHMDRLSSSQVCCSALQVSLLGNSSWGSDHCTLRWVSLPLVHLKDALNFICKRLEPIDEGIHLRMVLTPHL